MDIEGLISELNSTHKFFTTSCRCLSEEDSAFAPQEGMMTVAQQVAHTAQTIDWFFEGAFRAEGFDMDFEKHIEETKTFSSLTEALSKLDSSVAKAVELLQSKSPEELMQPMAEGPIMGGLPRFVILGGLVDHSAHHRGALSVYARLLGKTPEMPYA